LKTNPPFFSQDGCLSQCTLSGLDANSSTLLMSGMPGGWIIQVGYTYSAYILVAFGAVIVS
jgi:hypothetical protein